MNILSATQIREADAFTIKNEPISSVDLMERAATKCFSWLEKKYHKDDSFVIFCGVGNNGGDGLVIARLLKKAGYQVEVFVVEFSKKYSADFQVNLDRLKELALVPVFLTEANHSFSIKEKSIVIDAIFGSGLARPVVGFIAQIISQINNNEIVAIDIPSGLYGDDNRANDGEKVKAKYTLTFQVPKLATMFPSNFDYVGEWMVLDIGLNNEFIAQQDTKYYALSDEDASLMLQKRPKYAHKGSYGHALLVAGSKGKMGAAVLASRACLKTGVGLLTTHVPKIGLPILQTVVPEAMGSESEGEEFITDLPKLSKYNVIGVGPGIGLEKQTQNILKLLIQNAKTPLVLDADALNILSENKTWLSFLPSDSILTPHPKEFERLVGKWTSDEERLELQQNFSLKHNVYLVLKGANTSITTPLGNTFFNTTGNPGMATGGSGDVLTGIITSLLAQGYHPQEAAVLGVYLHGLAGDVAKENNTEYAMIASDIIESLPLAFGWLQKAV